MRAGTMRAVARGVRVLCVRTCVGGGGLAGAAWALGGLRLWASHVTSQRESGLLTVLSIVSQRSA